MRLVLFGVLAIMLVGVGWAAWRSWPPLLKYREKRIVSEYHAEIQSYLRGTDSLDVAAHRLAQVLIRLGSVIERQQWVTRREQSGSQMEITSIGTASDIPEDDPRVEELVLNAFKLSYPPGMSEAFRVRSGQWWDSIIHSKGYRSVP